MTKRLLIVNDDGHGGFFEGLYESPEALVRHLERFKGTGVTDFEWCVSIGTKVNILSDRFERFGTGPKTDLAEGRRGDRRAAETLARFAAAGADPLRLAAETLKRCGVRAHASIRMNPDYGPSWMGAWLPNSYNETFYFEHPEWRIVNRDGSLDAHLSYAFEPVRSRKLQLVAELLGYPVDGIQFDFLRHPPFVGREKPLAERFAQQYGVRPEQTDEKDPRWLKTKSEPMTAFMREARKLAGSRILSARIDHRFYEEQGLDIRAWIGEGLLDVLIVAERGLGGYSMDLKPFVALAGGRCKVLAGEEALCSGHDLTPQEDRLLAQGKPVNVERRKLSLEEYRERAKLWLSQGADGVHLFNDYHRFELYPELAQVPAETRQP
jgi:hypothetical protein